MTYPRSRSALTFSSSFTFRLGRRLARGASQRLGRAALKRVAGQLGRSPTELEALAER